ncbi:bis-aminopropyl spermidine synthase family protein [Nonomuraea harbinensis]|uniref:Bis-aminopropyl spermidine synthase family protein n=1 Tax=Nonomuraea harbinensis TaxID=1286938 RepID=A0ABW1BVF8_9ACTN|nr:bis-aminopropyl spermidine synthase family protein [Nonomuraea harbinensis]
MERDGVERLLGAAGVDSRRLRHALTLLCDGRWWSLADLVRETATSRRTVEELLRELRTEREGDRFRLPPAHWPDFQDLLALAPPPEDPVQHLVAHYEPALERLRELVAKAPRPRHALDHVPATPETVLRRALLLGARFWLPGARLLCVGDHDLTSVAVKLVHPETDVTVVDVDDRILAYIDEQRLGIHTRWADLRLGLPASARDHDLAVTDPPYTPEGVGLFVARALEGLTENGRVLLAYGASERTPALALKVQNALSALNVAFEAIYPDFNRYFGAEAIGSAADLYILRPTTKTAPAVRSRLSQLTTAIYTHGPQSVESGPAPAPGHAEPRPTPASMAESATRLSSAGEADLLVGEWPATLPQPRVKLATWLGKPYAASVERVAIAVPPGLEAALPRLLLATRAPHVEVHLAGPYDIPSALDPVYSFTESGAMLTATRRPRPEAPQAQILRRILDSGHAKLANTWREALIAVAATHDVTLTKNEARALIREAAPWAGDLTPLDAPLHRLTTLPSAIGTTLRSLPADGDSGVSNPHGGNSGP